jgi:hypothetical protein
MSEIRYTWIPVSVAQGVFFVFADVPTLLKARTWLSVLAGNSAIYRWGFFRRDVLVEVYIGETENFRQRVRGYLCPGPSQETNKRMNSEFNRAIDGGLEVRLEILKIEPAYLNRVRICNENLCDPFVRGMMENFILADIDVVNCKLHNIAPNKLERRIRKAMKYSPFPDVTPLP